MTAMLADVRLKWLLGLILFLLVCSPRASVREHGDRAALTVSVATSCGG